MSRSVSAVSVAGSEDFGCGPRCRFGAAAVVLLVFTLFPARSASQVAHHVPRDLPTIQQAIAAAVDGDTVVVGPGIYQETILIDRFISVVSSHGSDVTHISCPSQSVPVVGVYSPNGSPVLRGFTIRDAVNAVALAANSGVEVKDCIIRDNSGTLGVVFLAPDFGSAVFSRCVFKNNQGFHGGLNTLPNCFVEIAGGSGVFYAGGGTHPSILVDCAIVGNTGGDAGLNFCAGPPGSGGAGVYGGGGKLVMINCTVSGNVGGRASTQFGSLEGAGVFDIDGHGPTIHNCIVKGNVGLTFDTRDREYLPPILPIPGPIEVRNSNVEGFVPSQPPFLPDIFINNIDADPHFVDPVNGDFRLLSNSPCIDTGDAALAMSLTDFDGLPRVVGDDVDMGCHEYVQPLPGTDEGLELRTTIDGGGADLHRKFAPGGSHLIASIHDDLGAWAGAVPVLLGQVFGNDTPPTGIPSFPLHLDFPGLAIFHDGNATPGPLIGAMPVSFGPVAMPPGLAGLTLRLQAFGLTAAAGNAIFAATHARDLEFR